jgi:UDP-N-acetylmuramoylalanine--D-glutamate ligase
VTGRSSLSREAPVLIVGFGLHGQAVAAALSEHHHQSLIVDDAPSESARDAADRLGVELLVGPSEATLSAAVASASRVIPTPGLPESHPLFALSAVHGVPILSEFDLAREWDDRPVVAITGTNGKTTVTTMVTEMLSASGRHAVMAGNMELPLVAAINGPADVFVVEASSFRLGHSASFAPSVGTWLNFAPDHLDVHSSMAVYEAAKARIWADQGPTDIAVANADDPVVMANLPGRAQERTYGNQGRDAFVRQGSICVGGEAIVAVDALARTLPHDISNALAAALTALSAEATPEAVATTLTNFTGLPHRVQVVARCSGVLWVNDSKATTPQAVVAGLAGFESVVLIAGGRNKGVDLTPLRELTERLRGVVAIGEASGEIAEVFEGLVPVVSVSAMDHAISTAEEMARSGDVVALSPACTSFDWYSNYGARGEDFMRLVREQVGGAVAER